MAAAYKDKKDALYTSKLSKGFIYQVQNPDYQNAKFQTPNLKVTMMLEFVVLTYNSLLKIKKYI